MAITIPAGTSPQVASAAPTGVVTATPPGSANATVANLADASLGPKINSGAVQTAAAAEPRGPVQVPYNKNTTSSFVDSFLSGSEGRVTHVDINAGSPEEQKKARESLLATTPQINETAILKGDSMHTCGAASQTAALILTDKDGKNAAALDSMARNSNITLSDSEKAALANFKSGKLSPEDVENLQQIVYRSGVSMSTGQEPKGIEVTHDGIALAMKKNGYQPSETEQAALKRWGDGKATKKDTATLQDLALHSGLVKSKSEIADADGEKSINHELTQGEMGALTGSLRSYGAFADGPNVTYNLSELKGPDGKVVGHWTAQVDGTFYNSVAQTPGGGAQLGGHVPDEIATGPSKRNFGGRVSLAGTGDNQAITIDLPSHNDKTASKYYDRVQFRPAPGQELSWSDAATDFQNVNKEGETLEHTLIYRDRPIDY